MTKIKDDKVKKAVVLISGGIDSTTVLGIAESLGYELYCLTFCYGQRHSVEVEYAQRIAKNFNAKQHLLLEIDLRAIGGSALTDNIAIPKCRLEHEISNGIPVTYVPARNTIFLSYCLLYTSPSPRDS